MSLQVDQTFNSGDKNSIDVDGLVRDFERAYEVSGSDPSAANKSTESASDKGGEKEKQKAACVRCQKSHLKCDKEIPCNRCIRLGVADTCVQATHKRRGWLRGRKRGPRKRNTDAAAPVAAMKPTGVDSIDIGANFEDSTATAYLRSIGVTMPLGPTMEYEDTGSPDDITASPMSIPTQMSSPVHPRPNVTQQAPQQAPQRPGPTALDPQRIAVTDAIPETLLKFMAQQAAIIVTTLHGDIQYATSAIQQMIGVDREDVVGYHLTQLIHSDDVATMGRIVQSALMLKDTTQEVVRFRTGKSMRNEFAFVSIRGGIWREPTSGERFFVGKLQDASSQVVSSQTMAKKRAESRAFMIRFALDGTIAEITDGVQAVADYSPAEMTNKWLYNYVHPNDLSTMNACHSAMMAKPSAKSMRYRLRKRDGDYVYVESLARPFLDMQGNLTCILCTVRELAPQMVPTTEGEKCQEVDDDGNYINCELRHQRIPVQAAPAAKDPVPSQQVFQQPPQPQQQQQQKQQQQPPQQPQQQTQQQTSPAAAAPSYTLANVMNPVVPADEFKYPDAFAAISPEDFENAVNDDLLQLLRAT
eukprot:Clim_evm55s156 gene=Clim_evmTU55s156